VLATEEIPEILYKGSVSLTQPYVFHRRLSVVASPFLEYRDDYRDQSVAVGFLTTLIYQVDPGRTAALVYTISNRRVTEARYGEYASGAIDILSLLSIVARGDRVLKNSLGLQLSYGSLDDFTVPRRGYLLRPSMETTFIPGLNSVEYFRFDIPLYAFQPIGDHVGLAARISAGSILPFGKGLPEGEDDATLKFLQMRDVIFTAGGPEDVRGWASRLLGPKAPDIRVTDSSSDTTFGIEEYIPVGGLSRLAFSLECRLPFPGLGPSAGLSAYLDGARVWNAKPEFQSVTGWEDEDRFFFGTGLGILYRLPVGTLRVDAGYKLNPSFQDLRDAEDLWKAITDGTPLDQVPAKQIRRFYVHLSISVSF
jgi:outer membrane protein assembly factor BamA